jgi:hemerythrin superfamily protein
MPAQKLNDAIKLLMQDHKDVDALFKRYDKLVESDGPSAQRAELASQICAMLTVHTTIEEEIFYPAARAALKEQDLLDEAEVEHASAKDLIEQIQNSSPDSDLYDAKVKVLGEYIRHHVKEEHDEMFPKVRRTQLDLVLVGEAMASRKQELMGNTVPA